MGDMHTSPPNAVKQGITAPASSSLAYIQEPRQPTPSSHSSQYPMRPPTTTMTTGKKNNRKQEVCVSYVRKGASGTTPKALQPCLPYLGTYLPYSYPQAIYWAACHQAQSPRLVALAPGRQKDAWNAPCFWPFATSTYRRGGLTAATRNPGRRSQAMFQRRKHPPSSEGFISGGVPVYLLVLAEGFNVVLRIRTSLR